MQLSGQLGFQAEETANAKPLLLEPTLLRNAAIVWLKLHEGKGDFKLLSSYLILSMWKAPYS